MLWASILAVLDQASNPEKVDELLEWKLASNLINANKSANYEPSTLSQVRAANPNPCTIHAMPRTSVHACMHMPVHALACTHACAHR